MKVLYFHQHFSTPQGSTGVRSYENARRLVERGHSVTMVCGTYRGGVTGLSSSFANGRRRGIVDGIDVIEFDLAYSNSQGFLRRSWIFLLFALRSVGVALTESCDLVFATSTPLTAGIPGIFARWLRRRPFVFEVRDLWPDLPRAMGVIRNPAVLAAMSALEWISYRSSLRLVALAPGISRGIERRGVSPGSIAMIPNGCDLQTFTSKNVAWRPAGVPPDAMLAVYCGTHGLANGLESLLDAAAELKRRGRTDIVVALVGEGKLKAGLMARANRDRLDNVIFHEPVKREKLAGLLLGADLGLQLLANVPAFYYGTSPNKFFDYIAAGLPVLNNYPGWLAEMISRSDCGFAVPPDDPAAFADALEKAADDRAGLARKGGSAHALAKSEFDRSSLTDVFVEWITGAAA